jgi:beta-phosphoglucomutase-like phosphatase (HAD superfamily)
MIYTLVAERLGLRPEECVVMEDSNIGLEAARGAGMRCIITYTEATKDQARGREKEVVCVHVCYSPTRGLCSQKE